MSHLNFDYRPSELKAEISDLILCKLVPFITSPPGLGKSAIVAEVANDFNLELIDIRLSQCTPEDLLGLPMKDGNRARFVPFDTFPDESTPIPEGKDGWMIFFDEYNSANRGVIAASYKILHDKMVGMLKLHPNVVIVLAGNREEDNAIVNDIGTAAQSRVVHLGMRPEPKDFVKHAYRKGFDSRVAGFIEFQPTLIHDFDPDHTDKTYACPRTWEMTSKYIKGKAFDNIRLGTLAGILGEGAAVSFHAFMKEYANLPTFSDIITRPQTTPVPHETGTQFALVSMLIAKFDDKNFADVITYVKRLPAEIQVVFFRGAFARTPLIRKHPKFAEAQKDLTEFIYDDDAEAEFGHAA